MKTQAIALSIIFLANSITQATPDYFSLTPKIVTSPELKKMDIPSGPISIDEYQVLMRDLSLRGNAKFLPFPTIVIKASKHSQYAINNKEFLSESGIAVDEEFDDSFSVRIEPEGDSFRLIGVIKNVVSKERSEEDPKTKTALLITEATVFDVACNLGDVAIIPHEHKIVCIEFKKKPNKAEMATPRKPSD